MKILRENMRRFGTKNLNEQNIGDAAAVIYPRTQEDDDKARGIEQEIRNVRDLLTGSPGKARYAVADDDEGRLQLDFLDYWNTSVAPRIAKLNDKDPNKRTYMNLKDELVDGIGSSAKFIGVNVKWTIYLLDGSADKMQRYHDEIPGSGQSKVYRRFRIDI
jgi:hypothetical protein